MLENIMIVIENLMKSWLGIITISSVIVTGIGYMVMEYKMKPVRLEVAKKKEFINKVRNYGDKLSA